MNLADLILFAGVMLAFGAGALALASAMGARRKQVRARARALTRRLHARGASDDAPSADLRKVEPNQFPLIEAVVARLLPRPEILRERLSRTGKEISVGAYVAVCIVVAMVMLLMLKGIVGLSWLVALPGAVAAGVVMPYWATGVLAGRRQQAFVNIFPDAIDLMVRGLRSGLPVSECISTIGTEMANPVGSEFRAINDMVRLGQSMDDALWSAAKRLDIADFNFFVITLNVQRETGGNLAETLANLSDILRQRKQMKHKVKALSSEARASAYILGSLPFLMLGILMVLNTDYAMELFTDPRGHTAVAVGIGMLLTGIAVMFKMVRFEP